MQDFHNEMDDNFTIEKHEIEESKYKVKMEPSANVDISFAIINPLQQQQPEIEIDTKVKKEKPAKKPRKQGVKRKAKKENDNELEPGAKKVKKKEKSPWCTCTQCDFKTRSQVHLQT